MSPLDWALWLLLGGSYLLGLALPLLVHPLMVRPYRYLIEKGRVALLVVWLLVITFGGQ